MSVPASSASPGRRDRRRRRCSVLALTSWCLVVLAAASASAFATPRSRPPTRSGRGRRATSVDDVGVDASSSSSSARRRDRVVPVTVLSGFLGSGKTTLLQRLLRNEDGLRIAVVVNDVANVNVDGKLVSGGRGGSSDVVELSNGCACCSLSEELLSSVGELVALSDLRDDGGFDHIVVELSGVAEPRGVRAKFQEAESYGMPLMERVRLDTMVTVVDCGSFLNHLLSDKRATVDDSPELFYRSEKERLANERVWADLPPGLVEALGAAPGPLSTSASSSAVVELLVEQTETADLLVLNKVDQVDSTDDVRRIVETLNPRATVLETSFGEVDPTEVLGVAGGEGVVDAGPVDDHRDAVSAVLENEEKHSHSHSSHSHQEQHEVVDSHSHSHSHSHDHDHKHDAASSSSSSSSSSHDHSHSHSHSHSHQGGEDEPCNDPDCDDPTHDHSHSHDHDQTLSHYAGITSFVYRARRPFHPRRLLARVLRCLPVARGLPDVDGDVDGSVVDDDDGRRRALLSGVLRSKGFCWTADSDVAALYWSHAGAAFEMQCLGRWWTSLPRDRWPEELVDTVLADFDDPSHDEDSDDAATVGDRRQEVVVIGAFSSSEDRIRALLDECLLTDDEWDEYRRLRRDESRLAEVFDNPVEYRLVAY